MNLLDIAKLIGTVQGVVTAIGNGLAAHAATTGDPAVTEQDVRAAIAKAKLEALAAGDEAQARIDARDKG